MAAVIPEQPSALVAALLNDLHMSQKDAAKRLGLSLYAVQQLLNGQKPISAMIALRLERLDTKKRAAWWLQRQLTADEFNAQQERTNG